MAEDMRKEPAQPPARGDHAQGYNSVSPMVNRTRKTHDHSIGEVHTLCGEVCDDVGMDTGIDKPDVELIAQPKERNVVAAEGASAVVHNLNCLTCHRVAPRSGADAMLQSVVVSKATQLAEVHGQLPALKPGLPQMATRATRRPEAGRAG